MTSTTHSIEYSALTGWIDSHTDLVPPLTSDITCDVAVIAPVLGMDRYGLRTVWAVDRLCDLFNGSRRRARRAVALVPSA